MMEEPNYTGIIPSNESGKKINAEAAVELKDNTEAQAFYPIVKDRLLHVNNWQHLAGAISAAFKLFNGQGEEVNRTVQKGDYFRIDIPGPGSKAGEGYDWAYVEDMEEVTEQDMESIGIKVRPAANPQTNNNDVAHFFSKQSTSSFVVTREKNKITAGIYDRNIEPNEETESIADKARNTAVGLGAKHGFSKLQWQTLVNGFIERKR